LESLRGVSVVVPVRRHSLVQQTMASNRCQVKSSQTKSTSKVNKSGQQVIMSKKWSQQVKKSCQQVKSS
jgi:hypothetical protein